MNSVFCSLSVCEKKRKQRKVVMMTFIFHTYSPYNLFAVVVMVLYCCDTNFKRTPGNWFFSSQKALSKVVTIACGLLQKSSTRTFHRFSEVQGGMQEIVRKSAPSIWQDNACVSGVPLCQRWLCCLHSVRSIPSTLLFTSYSQSEFCTSNWKYSQRSRWEHLEKMIQQVVPG